MTTAKRVRPTTRTDIQSLAERKEMIYTRIYVLIGHVDVKICVCHCWGTKKLKGCVESISKKTSKLHSQHLASEEIQNRKESDGPFKYLNIFN